MCENHLICLRSIVLLICAAFSWLIINGKSSGWASLLKETIKGALFILSVGSNWIKKS